ncbi:hypothetical protein QT381_07155 [Galbitalea sp. SE-J8]|uniref:hypothetical protein n=1 Tax=Galbitalea sp. SE-J8 TaxID=3054952 RepID=UPI00259D1184|nr:hypothetical protein [Galbitalea sp. SE-J8]MDM4762782.1 hypothetical protein [Galbitalea sp. SE-J8]
MHSARARLTGVLLASALVGTALAAAAPLSAAAAAGGGPIVYVHGNNVWIADGDGGNRRQVTSGGSAAEPWPSPTEGDDGTIAAVKGALVHRMSQWGRVLNTLDVPPLRDVQGTLVDQAPSTIAIPPSGARIACALDTFTNGACGGRQQRQTTAFSSSTQLTDPNVWGLSDNDNPFWVTDDRVLVEGDIERIRYFDLGRGETFWFDGTTCPAATTSPSATRRSRATARTSLRCAVTTRSRTSPTNSSAPVPARPPGCRVVPTTPCPAAIRRGMTRRPILPDAPARSTRMRPGCQPWAAPRSRRAGQRAHNGSHGSPRVQQHTAWLARPLPDGSP